VKQASRREIERIVVAALAGPQPAEGPKVEARWPSAIRYELHVTHPWTATTWRTAMRKLATAGTKIDPLAPLLAIVVGEHLELHRTSDEELGWILSNDWPDPGRREAEALAAGRGAFAAAVRSRLAPSPLPADRLDTIRAAHDDRDLLLALGDELLAAGDPRGELLSYAQRTTADDPHLAILVHRFGGVADVLDDLARPRPRGLGAALARLAFDDRLVRALFECSPFLAGGAIPSPLAQRLVTYALDRRDKVRDREHAATILDHARRWVASDPSGLGNALASEAYSSHPRSFPRALALYELVIDADGLALTGYNNALWAVMADNNKLPVDPARHRRFLAACVRHGPENPGIFFNAACAHFELGEIDNTLEMIRAALQHGYHTPQQIRDEPLFAPIASDPRFVAVFERTERGAPNRKFPNLWTPSGSS
jgi:tetratricopeptide (TPR) repeat protein